MVVLQVSYLSVTWGWIRVGSGLVRADGLVNMLIHNKPFWRS